tara:strand:+ start:68 stop:253 length:186 start_codon:yes stop_codon:yes gene_type:complete
MMQKLDRKALPENPTLEEVLKNEIEYLERNLEVYANAADGFRQKASELRAILGKANIPSNK